MTTILQKSLLAIATVATVGIGTIVLSSEAEARPGPGYRGGGVVRHAGFARHGHWHRPHWHRPHWGWRHGYGYGFRGVAVVAAPACAEYVLVRRPSGRLVRVCAY